MTVTLAAWTTSDLTSRRVRNRAVIGTVAAGLVAWAGWRRRALTASGALAGWLTGALVTAAGWNWAAAMLGFFLSGTMLSQHQHARGPALSAIWEKGGRRDAAQVLANGGIAALAALVSTWRSGDLPIAAGMGALAASNADTWATEIGVQSAARPRRITDGRTVPIGTSGGVTSLGLSGSLAGAMFLAGIAAAVPLGRRDPYRLRRFIGISLAGLAGSLFDSLLGATVQASRMCPICHLSTERRVHQCGARTQLVRGYGWLDNDVVNVGATVAGAVVALLWEWRFVRCRSTSNQ